jgi:hypothetical protein
MLYLPQRGILTAARACADKASLQLVATNGGKFGLSRDGEIQFADLTLQTAIMICTSLIQAAVDRATETNTGNGAPVQPEPLSHFKATRESIAEVWEKLKTPDPAEYGQHGPYRIDEVFN